MITLHKPSGRRRRNGIPLPAAQKLFRQFVCILIRLKTPPQPEYFTFLRRPARAFGAAPAPLVLLRPPGAVGFHKPKQMPRLVSLRCSASPDGLAPLAAEPFALRKLSAWSPCGPRNPPVSSAAPGATIGVSLRGPRSPSVSSGILCVIPVPAYAGTGSGDNPAPLELPYMSFPRKRESRGSGLPFFVIPAMRLRLQYLQ